MTFSSFTILFFLFFYMCLKNIRSLNNFPFAVKCNACLMSRFINHFLLSHIFAGFIILKICHFSICNMYNSNTHIYYIQEEKIIKMELRYFPLTNFILFYFQIYLFYIIFHHQLVFIPRGSVSTNICQLVIFWALRAFNYLA